MPLEDQDRRLRGLPACGGDGPHAEQAEASPEVGIVRQSLNELSHDVTDRINAAMEDRFFAAEPAKVPPG